MTARRELTVTVIAPLLVLICATLCSSAGFCGLSDQAGTRDIGPTAGVPLICLALSAWIVPPLLSLGPVRGKEDRTREG